MTLISRECDVMPSDIVSVLQFDSIAHTPLINSSLLYSKTNKERIVDKLYKVLLFI